MMESQHQLTLDQTSALSLRQKPLLYKKFIHSQAAHWHKFVITGGAELDREKILKSIVDTAGEIFPIQYMVEGKNTSFIARNCTAAIDNLCARNLVVDYPGGNPVVLKICMNQGVPSETTLKIQDVVMQVLNKRYSKTNFSLNLENLVKDPVYIDVTVIEELKKYEQEKRLGYIHQND